MEVKDILKSKRQEAELSQNKLASIMHVDRSMISRWETGKSIPSSDQFSILCNLFGLDEADFIDEEFPTAEPEVSLKRINNQEIYSYLILLMCAAIYHFIHPWGFPLTVFSVYYAFKKRMPWVFKLFSILFLIYCVGEIMFLHGVYLIPPIVTID